MTSSNITTWKRFATDVRARQERLLDGLGRFPDAILVTGCQRSGGTMLSRVITNSQGMQKFWFSKDEELDAALILSGAVSYQGSGRHCFQTTYLNERWPEYLAQPQPFHMVWTLRNPHSVVYSMVYNWRRFALNELFLSCGFAQMDAMDRVRFLRFGLWGVPPLRRAGYAYAGKLAQLSALHAGLPAERLTVLEYDDLVRQKSVLLPALYARLALDFRASDAEPISERSLGKKSALNAEQRQTVDRLCAASFETARQLVNLR